jgi:hypothetical protein
MYSLAEAEEKIAAAQEGAKTKMLQEGRINSKPQKIGSLAMKSCKETKTSSNATRARAPPPSHGFPDFLRSGTTGQINLAGGQSIQSDVQSRRKNQKLYLTRYSEVLEKHGLVLEKHC